MEVTPTSTSSKRPRAKVVVKDPTAKPARKTLSTSRKKAAAGALAPPTPAELQSMIETAAFYLAAERQFEPGHELDDWLEAERRIMARYTSG